MVNEEYRFVCGEKAEHLSGQKDNGKPPGMGGFFVANFSDGGIIILSSFSESSCKEVIWALRDSGKNTEKMAMEKVNLL